MFRAFENPQNAKRVTNFFWYDSRPVKSSEGNRSSHQAAADQLDSLGACAAAPPKRAFGPKTPASQNARSAPKPPAFLVVICGAPKTRVQPPNPCVFSSHMRRPQNARSAAKPRRF